MQLSYAGRSDRSPVKIGDDQRTLAREGPRLASARRFILRLAGHLERLQTSRRRKKNSRWRLEELGFGDKRKGNKKIEK